MVKLPKDMQKKKKPTEIPLKKLKNEILKTFRSEFLKAKRKNDNDKREVVNENGHTSDAGDYVNIHYEEKEIKVKFNYGMFDNELFTRPDFRENFNFFKNHIIFLYNVNNDHLSYSY